MRVETDFFLKQDVKDVLEDFESSWDLDGGATLYAIDPEDYIKCAEKILEKIAEFVNENYEPKK